MRRALVLVGGFSVAFLAVPAPASAHGLTGRTDLPIPDWLFTWGAALVLVVSFLGLALLWPTPRLQREDFRPLPAAVSRALTGSVLDVVGGAIGVLAIAAVIVCGFTGAPRADLNLAPTFVYVVFWLGFVPVSVVFGDVFRLVNPWRALGRLTDRALHRTNTEPLPYPEWLGYWPAAGGLFAFAWLELVAVGGDRPSTVATATLLYTVITLVGMAVFGSERWSGRAEAFGVYFGLFARLSVFERRGDEIGVRRPLSGLPGFPAGPGSVVLLGVMIGAVTFDGFSAGVAGQSVLLDANNVVRDVIANPRVAIETTYGVGLTVTVAFIVAVYWLGIVGARAVGGKGATLPLARSFVHTLVPIALAYVAAHYVSLLLLQGQAIAPLASDPAGQGWNIIGTATWTINYAWIGAEAFWYLQVGFVVAGHLVALILAHDRALAVFSDPRAAVRSQYWLLGVMVAFTSLALWLLAQAKAG